MNVLTKEIAEHFSADRYDVDLSEFTAIEDDAAEILCKHEGELYLAGLTSLSDAAAESLSKHEGRLSLNGLTSLSDAAAESLCKYVGELSLNGLTSLSDSAAESLSKHEGSLYLNGLTSLTDAAARSLSGWCDKQGSHCWMRIPNIILMQIRHEPCCWFFGGEYNTDLIFAINLSCFSESEPVFGFHSDEHNARDLALDGLEIIDEQCRVTEFNEHAFVVMRALRNRIDEKIARITVDGGGEYNVEILHLPSEGSPKEILWESFCCK